jgi:hypothetical protein
MNNTDWIDLVRRIPVNRHEKLMVVTSIGIEIAVQNIMRLETEYLIMRGRLAGTTDMGRVFFIPYDQINYINLTYEMDEVQFEAMLGPIEFPILARPKLSETDEIPTEVDQEPEPTADGPAPAAGGAEPAGSPGRRPVKETLLERLRARAQSAKQHRKQ